jgi:predicted PurR-regulated permease PerM
MENTPPITDTPAPASDRPDARELTANQKWTIALTVVLLVALLVGIGFAIFFLLTTNPDTTAQIRDVFIIVMAVETLLIGLVMVILIVQLARLINLLQNEIKPILDSTNETVSHLRGTTMFLSDNLVGPVIKLNEYLAGFTQFLQVVGLVRRSRRDHTPKGE